MSAQHPHERLAQELFRALEAGDEAAVRACCHEDLVASQNGGPSFGLDDLIGFARMVRAGVEGFGYHQARRRATRDGFVEEHLVRARLADGDDFALPVCLVAEVREGRVARLREYFDGAAGAALLESLAAARGG